MFFIVILPFIILCFYKYIFDFANFFFFMILIPVLPMETYLVRVS
ncbi:unnamed protein product [Arabidopsis halleri]